MEILKTKKAQSPPPTSAGRRKKTKYISAEAVNDGDDGEMIKTGRCNLFRCVGI